MNIFKRFLIWLHIWDDESETFDDDHFMDEDDRPEWTYDMILHREG
jgi:hypothetical protein